MDQFHPDIIFTPFVLTAEAEAFGSEVVYLDKNPPNLRKPAIKDINDIAKLKIPDVDSHPSLCYLREATRLLAANCKGTVPVAGVLLTPMDLPNLIMGIDNWLETILFDEKNMHKMLEKSVQYFTTWANTLFEEGANFLVMPSMFSNPKIITEKIARETVMPVLREAFNSVKGPLVFHHGGNQITQFMDLYKDLPNVVAIVIDHRDSFTEARQVLGDDVLLLGNINGPNLWRRKPHHVRKLCEKILTDRKHDSHFILATTSADIAYDTPPENVSAVIESVLP